MRKLFGQPLSMIGMSMVLAGLWVVWWALPERPLRELRLVGQTLGTTKLAPDGKSLIATICSSTSGRKRTQQMALMNLTDGSFHFPFSADETNANLHVTPFYMDSGRLVMLSWPTALRMIDTLSGAVKWEAANLGYHRSWTDDGRLVVAESRDDPAKMDRTLLFDTSNKSVTELPLAAGPYGFDRSGHRLLTRVEAAPAVFAIWNTTTKTEIARYQDDRYQSIYGASINPVGTQVIVVAKVPNVADEERRGGFLWNLDNARVDLLELPERTKDYVSGHLAFTEDGQGIYGPDGYPRWVIKSGVTQKIEPAHERVVRAFPEAKRYLATREPKQIGTTSICTLFDDETNLPIALSDWVVGSSPAIMSPDARWMMIEDNHISNWFMKYVATFLRWLRSDTMSFRPFDVVSMETGRVRNRIPLVDSDRSRSHCIGFTNQNRLWTDRIDDHKDAAQAAFVLQEWSCYAAEPPWWLWLATVGGVVLFWKSRKKPRVEIVAPGH